MLQSLSESGERSRATWAGEAGGDTTVAASAVGVKGRGAGCATCIEMAKYGTKGSKAR